MRTLMMVLLVAAGANASELDAKAELKAVAAMMSGSYSSAEQAAKDPAYFDVRLQMAPIWTDRKDEHWIYVEQAMATALDKPYRQRVYKLVWRDGGPVSVVYTLPGDALQYAGAYKDAAKLKDLKPEQLTEKTGCAIVLKKEKDGSYKGATVGKGCASELKGASYATSEVTLSEKQLTSWDRGFDKDGKQVWGAVKGAYEFAKLKGESK